MPPCSGFAAPLLCDAVVGAVLPSGGKRLPPKSDGFAPANGGSWMAAYFLFAASEFAGGAWLPSVSKTDGPTVGRLAAGRGPYRLAAGYSAMTSDEASY